MFHTSDAEELERLLMAVLEPSRERVLRAALATEILGRDATAIEALADDDQAERRADDALCRRTATSGWRQGISSMLRQLMRDEQVSERLLAAPTASAG